MEKVVKIIKDNCYKETVGTGRDEELRYFMTEKDVFELAEELIKNHGVIADVVKSLPNDEEVKVHIGTLPYYGTCTTEYNEGFEDGVKWFKEQLAK